MRRTARSTAFAVLGLICLVAAQPASADHSSIERVSVGPAGGNGPHHAVVTSMSPNGRRITFTTDEALVPQDTDSSEDVYLRQRGRLLLASLGPAGGNGPHRANGHLSADASAVVFTTEERLTANDTDTALDIYRYRISNRATTLITPDPIGGFTHSSVSPNASRLLFFTADALLPRDPDSNYDLYEFSRAGLRLVTDSPDAATSNVSYCNWLRFTLHCDWAGYFANGRRILFLSRERLVPEDADTLSDWYALTGNDLELLTPGALTGGDGVKFSSDGTRMFLTTNQALDPADTDNLLDVYELSGGTARLLTPDSPPAPGLTRRDVRLGELVDDGDAVLVVTAARLIRADGDDNDDIYLFRDGVPELISVGSLGPSQSAAPHASLHAATPDGSHVVFKTGERLEPEDTDQDVDIYIRHGDTTELVSTGAQEVCPYESCANGDVNVRFLSDDGRRVFFETFLQHVPEDTDQHSDVYERFGGATTLISAGTNEPNTTSCGGCFFSGDGRRVVFYTGAPVLPEDTDGTADVYAVTANAPPDCGPVRAAPGSLLPADGALQSVVLGGATDPDGDPVAILITGVTQDEPVGSAPDASRAGGTNRVLLRAERDVDGDGRVYRVSFTASDGLGGSCSGTTTVQVPRQGDTAADSAPPSYDSFRG